MASRFSTLDRRQFVQSLVATAAATGLINTARAAEPGRRIGLVDDDLDNFHSNIYVQILRNDLRERGFTIAGTTSRHPEKGRQWSAKRDVPYFENAAALNDAVDCFAILAPGSPDVHLELCRAVFPFGKPTFVDKTFAPNVTTAQEIFDLADQHHIAVQSSSALRYTAVQQHVATVGKESVRHMIAWGSGGSFDEYVVHPVEMVVSCLGPGVKRLLRLGTPDESVLVLEYPGDRTAVVNLFLKSKTSYMASITTDKQTDLVTVDINRLFVDAAAGMLDFFEAGKPLIDRHETLTIQRVIDAARNPASRDGWVQV